jgi:hypothetical protein
MSEYTIWSTEFIGLSRTLTPQEEASWIIKNSQRVEVKFVIIEQRERVLKLLVFAFDDVIRHIDIVRKFMKKKNGDIFFGAGKIYHLQSLNTAWAWWESESCIEKFKRDAPEISTEESAVILREVKQRARDCLTHTANGETPS